MRRPTSPSRMPTLRWSLPSSKAVAGGETAKPAASGTNSPLVAGYDANNDGILDKYEYRQALRDFSGGGQ